MLARSSYGKLAIALAMAGMLNPCLVVQAESPASLRTQARVPDVRLDAERRFHGVVVDGQGQAVARAEVTLVRAEVRKAPEKVWTATTDRQGRFQFDDLPAGTYRLETSTGVYLCRLWTEAAAPPAAAPALLVVNDARIERGQRPIGELFHADPLLMATIVAAAIAIPIAVHKSRDDSPEGS